MDKHLEDHSRGAEETAMRLKKANERAMRLKNARNLANLTREQMCKDDELLNFNTLTGWERSKYGGLTENGAKKIIARLIKEGVVCSLEWLMEGEGSPPYIDYDYLRFNSDNPLAISNTEEQLIEREINFFKATHENATSAFVTDAYMLPQYHPGDYVAGIKRYNEDIPDLLGLNCVVETQDGRTYIRNLKAGTLKNTYTLASTNFEATDSDAIIYNVKLTSAAPIVWHRKKEPKK